MNPSAALLLSPNAFKCATGNDSSTSSKDSVSSSLLPPRPCFGSRASSEPPVSLSNFISPPWDGSLSAINEDAYLFEAHSTAGPQRSSDSLKCGPTMATPAGTAFDPRHLLSPRNYQAKKSRTGLQTSTSPNITTTNVASKESQPSLDDSLHSPQSDEFDKKRVHDAFQGEGQGSLIESMYGVESRENQPRKSKVQKHEQQVNTGGSKARFTTSGEAGLGEYMRSDPQKRQPTSRVETVDLTLGDFHRLF